MAAATAQVAGAQHTQVGRGWAACAPEGKGHRNAPALLIPANARRGAGCCRAVPPTMPAGGRMVQLVQPNGRRSRCCFGQMPSC